MVERGCTFDFAEGMYALGLGQLQVTRAHREVAHPADGRSESGTRPLRRKRTIIRYDSTLIVVIERLEPRLHGQRCSGELHAVEHEQHIGF